MRVRSIGVVVGLVVMTLCGCARVSDGAKPTTSGTAGSTALTVEPQALADSAARQRISEGFGATPLVDEQAVQDGRSAMDVLRASTPVQTAYGGGFVSGMYGRESRTSPRRDWMYFVNGLSPGVGAADYTVRPGDRIWWDFRTWDDSTPTLPVVVGSWPEPFVHGYPAAPASVQADPPLAGALTRMGAHIAARPSPWRVIVGANTDLIDRDDAWRRAMDDPAGAGLAVGLNRATITAMGVDGRLRPVAGAGALAAMVLSRSSAEQGGVVFAVAGIDGASALAAARTIANRPDVLAGRVAVVFDRAGTPIAAAGRSAP